MQNPKEFHNFENAQWLVEPVLISADGYEHSVTDFNRYVGQDPKPEGGDTDAV